MRVDVHRQQDGKAGPEEARDPEGFVHWLDDASGFVVTTAAYLRALDQFGGRAALRARITEMDRHDQAALTRAAKKCHALVRSVEVPAAVHRSVLEAYARLERDAGRAVPVTVRPSPTPDGPAWTSTAGMDVTFADVRGGLELVDRVIECRAARWSPRVVTDRAARALTREPAIAVVIQRAPTRRRDLRPYP